jgi:hypothetical protein
VKPAGSQKAKDASIGGLRKISRRRAPGAEECLRYPVTEIPWEA